MPHQQPPHYISDEQALSRLCDQLESCTRLGIDTEFIGEDSFVPRLELIQLSTADFQVVLDFPLLQETRTLPRLWEIICSMKVEKVVHGTRLDGDSGLLNVNIYVDLLTPWDNIAASVPEARALFVMSDLLDWNPRGRLEGFPAVTYFANPDGLWFETEGGPPAGVYAEIADVERRWGEAIPTLDDFIAKLEVAAAEE